MGLVCDLLHIKMDVLFPPLQAPFEIARNPAFIVSAAGRTCLLPRGDLRRVGEKSAVGLALPNPLQTYRRFALLKTSNSSAGEETLASNS